MLLGIEMKELLGRHGCELNGVHENVGVGPGDVYYFGA